MVARPDHDELLVLQRLRNRQIGVLELASSWTEQRQYQEKVKSVSVSNEVLNQWDDVFPPVASGELPKPPYSTQEETALREFAQVLSNVSNQTPNTLPDVPAIFDVPVWADLKSAAQEALDVLLIRGKFSEDMIAEEDG